MKILVVDDNKIDRLFLHVALKQLGYDIVEAVNGHDAISALDSQSINIVISDWMMPGMDGIELCQHIRARNDSDGYIYVIMVTSKADEQDLMKGFEAGVDAYLQKPISIKILNVQIKVGIRIINLEKQLTYEKLKVSRFAHEMETLAKQRAKQLVHADRMASLGVLAAGIAHEINNPATFINGNIQTFEKFWSIIQERLLSPSRSGLSITDAAPANENATQTNENSKFAKPLDEKDSRMAFIIDEMPGLIDGIRSGTRRIQKIVGGLKSYARQENPEPIESDVHKIIDDALLLCHNSLKYNITVEKSYSDNLPPLFCDPQQIEQVFVNIFNNSADAMENMAHGILGINTARENNQVVICIDDNGPGLTRDSLDNIWDPFFTTKPVGKGTGLGMSISHGIIKSHGGSITAENNPAGGARFTIKFPVNIKNKTYRHKYYKV